jgi:hypothetical protein
VNSTAAWGYFKYGGEGGILTLAFSASPRVFNKIRGSRIVVDDFYGFAAFNLFNYFYCFAHISGSNRHQRHQGVGRLKDTNRPD